MLKKFLLLVLCSVFSVACRDFKEIQVTGVEGFHLNKINAQGIDGDIMVRLKNPNPYGFSLFRSDFDVTYSGVYLGKASLGKKIRIRPNEEKVYSVNIKNDFKDVDLGDVMKLLSGASFKNLIEVKGDLKVGKLFVRKKIPVSVKEKLKLN